MELVDGKIVINGARSQYDRWRSALEAEYTPVDGRSFSELLEFAIQFASLVQFYGLDDQPDGDWVDFFLADPTMILGSMEAADLPETETAFLRLEQQTARQQYFHVKFALFREMFELILRMAWQVNLWIRGLRQTPNSEIGRLLLHDITSEVESDLGEQLRKLKAYDEGAGLKSTLRRPIGLDYEGFLAIWRLRHVEPDGSIYRVRSRRRRHHHDRIRMIDHALRYLNPILSAFVGAISNWQTVAQANLPTTLDTGDHKPQIALYIAFARLFHTAQATVNTLSRRYVHFYYHDVLRQRRRPPVPDSVYLTLQLVDADDVSQATVARGTLFSAGQDANANELLYASDRDLIVSRAEIQQLRTLHVDRGPLCYKPPNHQAPRVVRRILSAIPPLAADTEEVGGNGIDGQNAWPLFGPAVPDPRKTNGSEVSATATLGFAIASPYLLLTGGERTVQLKVSLTHSLDHLLKELRDATGLDNTTILKQVLQDAFLLFVSTSTGWLPVESYSVTVSGLEKTKSGSHADDPARQRRQFTLRFSLPTSAPAVVAYDPAETVTEETASTDLPSDEVAATTSNPAPKLPTLKVYLRQTLVRLSGRRGAVDIYRLSLLNAVQLVELEICTSVRNLANSELTNTDGEIDTSASYMPFGGLPVVGSRLQIRNQELFVKVLDRLSITIDWFNLPPNETGFWGYYRDYVIGLDGQEHQPGELFNNQSFRARINVLDPGSWQLHDCRKQCQRLSQAEQCIAAALACLADSPNPSDLAECLWRCLICLVREALACLDDCQGGCGSEAVSRIKARLDSLSEADALAGLPRGNPFRDVLRKLLDRQETVGLANTSSADPCLPICNAIFEAIDCVLRCCGSDNPSGQSLEACLTDCRQRLIDAYATDCLGAYLFRTRADCDNPRPTKAGTLCTHTRFDFKRHQISGRSLPPYYDPSQSAIELELTAPPYAFGNDLYAQNVLNAVIEDLPDTEQCQLQCQAACQVLADAAANVNLCLLTCVSKETGEEFKTCVGPCLQASRDSVLLEWIGRFLSCLEQCLADSPAREAWEDRQKRIEACLASPSAELVAWLEGFPEVARHFQQCRDEFEQRGDLPRSEQPAILWFPSERALYESYLQCVATGPQDLLRNECRRLFGDMWWPCLKKCWTESSGLLEAAQLIEQALLGVDECGTDKACMEALVHVCQARLEQLYSACLKACLEECIKPKQELKYPNEPYLPQVEKIAIEYSATCVVPPVSWNQPQREPCGVFFHLLPFGGFEQVELTTDKASPLLPQFPDDGNLYLGFAGLMPPQPLTLLFQMASDAAAGVSAESTTRPINWSYLTNNRWQTLDSSEVRSDSTNGLQHSGVVALGLPAYDTSNSTIMPPPPPAEDEAALEYQWLRAAVKDKADLFPKVGGIYPHAVLATWRDIDNTAEHLRAPLPPHTISSAAQDLPDIAAIDQPMESFGGRPPETMRTFESRLGERLRHKDRASLAWDYEQLVLERFPTIWKVQTLPARGSRRGGKPGSVLVVVVPGPDSIQVAEPTAPLASRELLRRIQTYLSRHVSPFVHLQVVNPNYLHIEVTTTVQFRSDEDRGECVDRLNDDLIKYLSPWFYDAARSLRQGHYTSEADISEFIQTRPYVEVMRSLALAYIPKHPSHDWYFLTSAKQHHIRVTE